MSFGAIGSTNVKLVNCLVQLNLTNYLGTNRLGSSIYFENRLRKTFGVKNNLFLSSLGK